MWLPSQRVAKGWDEFWTASEEKLDYIDSPLQVHRHSCETGVQNVMLWCNLSQIMFDILIKKCIKKKSMKNVAQMKMEMKIGILSRNPKENVRHT